MTVTDHPPETHQDVARAMLEVPATLRDALMIEACRLAEGCTDEAIGQMWLDLASLAAVVSRAEEHRLLVELSGYARVPTDVTVTALAFRVAPLAETLGAMPEWKAAMVAGTLVLLGAPVYELGMTLGHLAIDAGTGNEYPRVRARQRAAGTPGNLAPEHDPPATVEPPHRTEQSPPASSDDAPGD